MQGKFAVPPPTDPSNPRHREWLEKLRSNATPQFFSWTPVLTCATPGDLTVAYTSVDGSGIKIGSLIVLNFFIVTSTFTWTTATGQVRVTGSPYSASSSVSSGVAGGQFQGITKAGFTAIQSQINSSGIISFTACGSGQNATSLSISDMPTGGTVRLFYSLPFIAG